jgi:hemerythrin-like domain-containing protein
VVVIRLLPIGPLMIEHRLIERMVSITKGRLKVIGEEEGIDPVFVDMAVDFFRTYADRCHHGKEENILFRDLAKKQLSAEHKKIMDELMGEHAYARKAVGMLKASKDNYVQGQKGAMEEIVGILKQLTDFYPRHIEKEDRHFFAPSMGYFGKQELDDMLQEFWEFDRKMIHEKYRKMVDAMGPII